MLTLVIGNKNLSSWSLRPWLLLRHFGIPFQEVGVLLDTPEFLAQIAPWTPNGRVPALRDGDLMVWDSLAICEYINERYLDGRGWPADIAVRAHARAAVAEMHSGFAALRKQCPMNMRRTPDDYCWDAAADADIARVQQLWRDLRAWHGQGGDFLCGEFGIVDAMFAPVVSRFLSYGVPMDDTAQAFANAIQALPAWQAWRADADAEVEALENPDHARA
ncbi:glutathione S-transferase [Lysobacter helvus]|uniref:Glutathione S-transferase n=2 Tax=Lysobacteraceae TaxID=32033 RepID=A0ABN6FPK1_9GAMM|nr:MULTISPECIES: glutathione S-transferase family protein [Lysobacter]BCT91541.1 glutathione S-transferase [Lysobacter caseinilyticus]BCT94694.1 glutathione S-transferase [Lysobacter helvus]